MGDKQTPAPELYPGHRAELEKHLERAAAISEAGGEPLPGPLLDAFAGVPEEVAGLSVRPLVHYDFVILKQLNSPLLDQLRKGAKAETAYTDDQAYEMVFQFTRPVKEVAGLLQRGRELFADAAREQIGMRLGPMEVALLVQAVGREFVRYFSTAIKYGPKQTSTGETVFTPPPAQMTASAGGSTTSAG